jgi:NAD(P)-dependent dehydrogenase (short-subunit alcohol dehydrogenase family)
VLVNAAGGNQPEATVPVGGSFFDLDADGFRAVVELNLMGTFLATQVFARTMAGMAGPGSGSVINISSVAGSKPLSRTAGYGAAKAGVENLTRWLADHIARQVSPGIRVNAVAPGFFLGAQNRALLTEADGSLSERGRAVVARTPMGRLGSPEDLVGTVVWLASDASAFVTGTVVAVDGGFSAATGI